MGTLIDSSILIGAERRKVDFAHVLAEHANEEVAIAAITASELLHGVHRAATAIQRTRREAFVEQILAVVPVVPFDTVAARVHAGLWAQLAAKGVSIGAHDLQIAATALSIGFDVASADQRSFPKILGLTLRSW